MKKSSVKSQENNRISRKPAASLLDHENELLTTAEVASYLKLSQRTAWRWCKSGRLPAYKVGHQWRVARQDLEAFVEHRL